MSNDFIKFMRNRVSQPALASPGPSKEEWLEVLDAASRAADHRNLKPWRFRVYEGEGRNRIGQIYWQQALSELDDLDPSKEASFVKKAFRAPTILLVYAHIQEHSAVPDIEQIMATAAAAQQSMLGLNALGYGTMWRSGSACFTSKTKELLELDAEDQIVGLIYVGTPTAKPTAPEDTGIKERIEWVSY